MGQGHVNWLVWTRIPMRGGQHWQKPLTTPHRKMSRHDAAGRGESAGNQDTQHRSECPQ